jgi:hypothetical protein
MSAPVTEAELSHDRANWLRVAKERDEIKTERDQLRAENKAIRHELAVARNAECLARTQLDLARAERDAERARLDSGQIMLTVAGERVWHCGVDLRAAIDAAMKEGGK